MSETTKNLPHGNDDRFKDALIFGYLEGKLSAEQLEVFDAALCNDREFSQRFVDTALLMQTLQSPSVSGQLLVDHEEAADDLPFGGSAAWESAVKDALASKRRSEIEHEAGLLLAQDKAERNRETRLEKLKHDQETKPHQTRNYVIPIWSIPVAIAAAIMLVAIPLATLFQDKPEPNQQNASTPDAIETPYVAPVLANVVRTLDAQWLDGDGLWNGTTGLREGEHHLAQGLVEIELSKGTRVVLEAPVTFELTGTNALKLSQGRLVATVPPAAIGFTIDTPSAHIIDYGTEFGVEALVNGVTQAHVFNGEIHTAPRINGEVVGEPVALFEQEAVSVATGSTAVRRVTLDAASFERRVVKRLDLVDIVAGGDGTGQARMRGIHPQTGRATSRGILGYSEAHLASARRYSPVPSNAMIDGVFIPHRANGIQIDSIGRTVSGLAVSDPQSYGLFWAGGLMPSVQDEDVLRQQIAEAYPENPNAALVLYMISNKGITFDLHAMRDATNSGQSIRFRADIESLRIDSNSQAYVADVLLYLDGEPVESILGMHPGDARVAVDVLAQPDHRFLTIVVADGGDGIGHDWIVLHQPVLEVLIAEADVGDSP